MCNIREKKQHLQASEIHHTIYQSMKKHLSLEICSLQEINIISKTHFQVDVSSAGAKLHLHLKLHHENGPESTWLHCKNMNLIELETREKWKTIENNL